MTLSARNLLSPRSLAMNVVTEDNAKKFAEEQTGQKVELYSKFCSQFAFENSSGNICIVMWNPMKMAFQFNNNPNIQTKIGLNLY